MNSIIFEKFDFHNENKDWWDINAISYNQIFLDEYSFSFVGGGACLKTVGKEYHRYLVKKFNDEIPLL